MTTNQYQVAGMHCSSCAASVTEEVLAVPGVTDVKIALDPEGLSTVTVEGNVEKEAVVGAVKEAGYAVKES